jgi:DsbC/DsbD-like thiol-disulfide interchange protein
MRVSVLLLTIIAILAFPGTTQAQAPRPSDVVSAELRPGWRTQSGTVIAAVHLKMARNWITYWRHPGEAGIAPRLDLSGSGNLAGVRLHWPAPRLFTKAGYLSIGYADELVLPIELTPRRTGQPIDLRAALSVGVCDEVCIPVDMQFSATLSGNGTYDRLIANALDRQPASARAAGLTDVSCGIEPAKRGVQISARWAFPDRGVQEYLLVEVPGPGWRVRPMASHRAGAQLTGTALLRATGQGNAIDRSSVRMTLITSDGTYEHQGCSLTR